MCRPHPTSRCARRAEGLHSRAELDLARRHADLRMVRLVRRLFMQGGPRPQPNGPVLSIGFCRRQHTRMRCSWFGITHQADTSTPTARQLRRAVQRVARRMGRPLAKPIASRLELSFDSRLVYHRPYFANFFSPKFIEYILGK